MDEKSKNYRDNMERTEDYLENFSRERVLKSLVKKADPFIIDVGANKGQSIKFFLSLFPYARIVSFEPQESLIPALKEVELAYPSNEILIINKACGGKNHSFDQKFYQHDISSGLAGFNKLNIKSKDSLNLSKLSTQEDLESYQSIINHESTVQTISLESFCNERGIDRVDILKVDTQGFEPEVLDGAGEILQHTSIVLVELMFYDLYERSVSFYDVEKYLHKAGLYLFDISHISKNPLNGRTDWVDAIYVRSQPDSK